MPDMHRQDTCDCSVTHLFYFALMVTIQIYYILSRIYLKKRKKINFSQISYFCNLSDGFDYKHKMKNDGCQEFSAMTTMMYEVYKPRGSAGPQSLGVGRHTPGPRTCIPKPDLLPHISNTRLKQCF